MKGKIILDLCGGSGAWSYPYREAGYDVRLITLPINDVRSFVPPENVYGILAAPPCTDFSTANWKKKRDLDSAMEIVNACLRIIEIAQPKFHAIENPIGLLSKFLGKPQYSFQPYEFGDGWTRRTMLWGKFNPPIKTHKSNEVPNIKGLYVRPGRKRASIAFNHLSHKKFINSFDNFPATDDASFRAITPQGFATAFFNANP